MNNINFLFVTLFGIGKLKKIPGSYASLVTTIFLFFLFHILNFSPNIVLIGVIIIFFISIYAVNIFILFRIFDITKPYPVSYYDKNFKNSFGVIMDDVCAGLYVVAVLVLYMVITS